MSGISKVSQRHGVGPENSAVDMFGTRDRLVLVSQS